MAKQIDEIELLEIVNRNKDIIGVASRSECHQNPTLIHRSVHILIFNSAGLLLLQKRAKNKDVQPDKWDSSVGGHLSKGEDFKEAAYREMQEELGIEGILLQFLYEYIWSTRIETEIVKTYLGQFNEEIFFNNKEIQEVRFWDLNVLMNNWSDEKFTPNLKEEICRYSNWKKNNE